MVIDPNWAQRVWVMSDVGANRCSAFELEYLVFEEDCDRRYYPFICETGKKAVHFLNRDTRITTFTGFQICLFVIDQRKTIEAGIVDFYY